MGGRRAGAGPRALFLIVILATLAMPGSANFIGEFYILDGLFQSKIVFAFVARRGGDGRLLRLRLYQRTMHNRQPDGVSRVRSASATASSSPPSCSASSASRSTRS